MGASEKKKMSAEEQQQAWLKYAAPGEAHGYFRRLEGRWRASVKFWMGPAAPPQASDGMSENTLILGGRFLQSKFMGDTPFGPFEGMSIDGYDQLGGKHIGVWLDSMGTMMMWFEGTVDESGAVREMISNHLDAATGEPAQMKSKTTIISDDEHLYEGFKKEDDGWLKNMEITYTRKK